MNNNIQASPVVKQLQQEVQELRQNEKDYQELNYLLTNCEHRFNLLADEKLKNEQDYEKRISMLQDTLADLRTKIDSQNQQLSETTQELSEMKSEYYRLSQLQTELLELKKEIPFLLEENERLKEELNNLQNYNSSLKEEKFKISEGFDSINSQFENQLMDYQKLNEQLQNYQEENQNLQKELQQYKVHSFKILLYEKQQFANELQKLVLNFTEINGIIDSERLLDNQTQQLENNISSQLNSISSIINNEKPQYSPNKSIMYSVQKSKNVTEPSIIKTIPHYQFTNLKK